MSQKKLAERSSILVDRTILKKVRIFAVKYDLKMYEVIEAALKEFMDTEDIVKINKLKINNLKSKVKVKV